MRQLLIVAILLQAFLLTFTGFAQQHTAAQDGEAVHGETGHAGEGHGAALGGENASTWKTINFVILIGGLVYLLRGKVAPFFAEKNKSIAQGMAVAAEKEEAAQIRLRAVEAKLADLDKEIVALKESASIEMERDRERIQSETATAIARLQERAEAEIESTGAQASARLRHEASVLALDLAERQAKAEASSSEMQNWLVVQAAERLGGDGDARRN